MTFFHMQTSKEQLIKYEDENFLIAFKPGNLPTVPLKNQTDRDTLLSRAAYYANQVLQPMSDKSWEGGVVHRLDTDTKGLVLISKTEKFFDYIQQIQKKDLFKKTYKAICTPLKKPTRITKLPFIISTYFRAYGVGRKKVKVETEQKKSDNKILYTTTITDIKNTDTDNTDNKQFQFTVTITKGFRHQIRAHLAWLGYPICQDKLYNPNSDNTDISELQLTCTALEFPLPDNRLFTFNL